MTSNGSANGHANGHSNGNGHHHHANGNGCSNGHSNGHSTHAPQPGSVLCIGNALLDVTFFSDAAFLEAHGLNANDACLLEQERYQAIHADLLAKYKTEDYVPGGAAQNTARATQWLLEKHPGTVSYLGSITEDNIGSILKEKAKEAGVNGIYQVHNDGTPTGCCLVILSDHHRSLAAFLGAALKFNEQHVKENWKAVEKAKIAYIEGFFLSTCFEACMLVARHMVEHAEKRLFLNLSAEFVTKFHKNMLLEIMPYVDCLFGNDTEALSFSNEMGFGTDLVEVAKKIAGMEKKRADPPRIVVITCGAEPVIVAVGPDHVFRSEVDKLPSEAIIDTNGAGDAFCGGFIAQLIRGKSLQEATKTGSKMASIVIQRLGCTFPDERPDLEQMCK